MTNTINNVPRDDLDLIRAVLEGFGPCIARDDALQTVRAILSAPSPAGVDGCKCSMSIRVLGDGCRHCQPQEYIDRLGEMLDEERAELSDAQAVIDGLRARCFSLVMNCAAELETASYCMTDEEAKRIAQSGADYYRKEARLSAGKEGE